MFLKFHTASYGETVFIRPEAIVCIYSAEQQPSGRKITFLQTTRFDCVVAESLSEVMEKIAEWEKKQTC